MSSAISSCLRHRGGTTAVEFGLVAGVFVLMMLGAMQIGLYLFTKQALEELTGVVARGAVVGTVTSGCPATLPSTIAVPPLLTPANLQVCVTQTNSSGETQVQVISSYQFDFFLPIMAGDSGTVSESTAPLY